MKNTNVKVFCPTGCASSTIPIYGNIVYRPDSSICKMAIHNGVISNDGGLFEVAIESSAPEYEAKKANDIQSEAGKGGSEFKFSLVS